MIVRAHSARNAGTALHARERIATARSDLVAGLSVASVSLPICLATGLLVFGPLGPGYVAPGLAAALYGFMVGGLVAALAATSSFVVSSPRASTALVQASMLGALPAAAPMLEQPIAVIAAMSLCVLLAGVWQLLFAALGIARLIKFTPHPVLAGFINGIGLLIIVSQLKPFVGASGAIERPFMLALALCLAAGILYFGKLTKTVPAALVGLVGGTAIYYATSYGLPSVDLGPVIGTLSVSLPPRVPLSELRFAGAWTLLEPALAQLLATSLALAIVATLESMLSFRAAQALSPGSVDPVRDLLAQGAGNCASGLAGGMAITASPLQLTTAFRSGGRTRLAPLTAIFAIGALAVGVPGLLAAIPIVVLSALLIATGVLLFDRWSGSLLGTALGRATRTKRRRAWSDLAIVALVMLLTAAVSIAAGLLAGCVLACLVFIVNMSRPIIRRESTGEVMTSKRWRAPGDAALLRESGARRRVIELQGVLFFGNADDLSHAVHGILPKADAIVLDMRGVSDVDASGASILRSIAESSRKAGRRLLFCNVPPPHADLVGNLAGAQDPFADLDSALEWMEEQALHGDVRRPRAEGSLPIWEHSFMQGLAPADREAFAAHLERREFPAGSILCTEGEPADRMWLLTRGSVSIRLRTDGSHGSRRLASCAVGTTIGEMALLRFGLRSATVIADEDVEAYELTRDSFDGVCASRPEAAAKLLRNMATELGRRLRERSDDLRVALGH